MIDLTDAYKLIKHYEKCHLTPYYCPAGKLTCGWGSTGIDVVLGVNWTQEYADLRLKIHTEMCSKLILEIYQAINNAQHCALVDFAYNLGFSRLKASTLGKKVKAGALEAASKEFGRWVYGGGVKLNGLILRRESERLLFQAA